jgi:uncharacterized UPF0160 family protein
MKELLKELLNKYKYIFVVVIIITTIVYVSVINYITKQNEIEQLKKELLVESDSEVISKTIKAKAKAKALTEEKLKELEDNILFLDSEVNCWKNQMNRLIDNLEYNLDYCTKTENLKGFQ